MAAVTAYHLPSPDHRSSTLSPAIHYPRELATNELDFRDTRYPIISSSPPDRRTSALPTPYTASPREDATEGARRVNSDPLAMDGRFAADARETIEPGTRGLVPNGVFLSQEQRHIVPSKLEAVVQYALPQDTARRVVERYSEEKNGGVSPAFDRSMLSDSPQESATASRHQPVLERPGSRERPTSMFPANSPRHPSLIPGPGVGAGPSNRDSLYSPIVPSCVAPYAPVSPTLGIPVSPQPRVYAQQPTYASAPNPISPIYMPNPPPPPQEEVCVECAMRDQDMADVDVTSPGVWERESDALYEELIRRELDEDPSEMISSESHRSRRPRAKGGKLTEPNLKLWLTMVS